MNTNMPHVLIVDDDDRLLDLLQKYLIENKFRVTGALSADSARAVMKNISFDLLVMDLMMPGESGLEFAYSIREQNNSFKDIPILMLTAMGESQDRIQGLEAGVDDYMVKPFEPRELLLRINSILRRIPTDSTLTPTEALLGVLRFDLERLELFEGENIINLTSGEAKLLGILASVPGEVFSREELNNRLDLNSGERAIDVQINRLRQKIELDPKSPRYLHTVRGKGYVLRPD